MLSDKNASIGLGVAPISNDDFHGQQQSAHPPAELEDIEASKSRRCLKKMMQFLFSHIGLVGLVAVYAVAGGFLFELLEQHTERVTCQEAQGEQMAYITKLKQTLVAYIQYNTTAITTTTIDSPFEKDNSTTAFAKIGAMLIDYRNLVINATSTYQYYGDNCSVINKWTYPNSLLFAITVFTTIGYGNITPVTWEGQLCCICYATIGIPIFLLCLANISGVLGEMFRFIYGKIICRPCYIIKQRRAAARKAKLDQEEQQVNGVPSEPRRNNGWIKEGNEPGQNSIKKNDQPVDETDLTGKERVAVPLTVTMIIIAGYIWIGSVLFHNFEGWTMIQAGYFCFITLATIGFGDFVPGQRKDDPHAAAKLLLGAIYVLFGMAILAMCFDLMQEEIVSKFRWLGKKIGIVEKSEDNYDENLSQGERLSIDKSKQRSSTQSSINFDQVDWSKEVRSTSPRKTSPGQNISRVHPTTDRSLHQRVVSPKSH